MDKNLKNIAAFLIGLLGMFMLVISTAGEQRDIRVTFEEDSKRKVIKKIVRENVDDDYDTKKARQNKNPFLIFNPIYL